MFQSKFDIPQDEIAREIIKRHNLKRLGDQWRNWKHALKAKHFDKSKTETQTVAKAPNIVNHQDYAELVDSWFRGNTIKIMHVRIYVFVIIFFSNSHLIYSLRFAYIVFINANIWFIVFQETKTIHWNIRETKFHC